MHSQKTKLFASSLLIKKAAMQNYGPFGEPLTPATSRIGQTANKAMGLMMAGAGLDPKRLSFESGGMMNRPSAAGAAANRQFTPAYQPRVKEMPAPAGGKPYDPMGVLSMSGGAKAPSSGPVPVPSGPGLMGSAGSAGGINSPLGLVSGQNKPVNPMTNLPLISGRGAAPAAAASPAAGGADMNALFKKYMGSAFDPNSKLDAAKMKYLQDLSNKGVALNAANIYDQSRGYGNW